MTAGSKVISEIRVSAEQKAMNRCIDDARKKAGLNDDIAFREIHDAVHKLVATEYNLQKLGKKKSGLTREELAKIHLVDGDNMSEAEIQSLDLAVSYRVLEQIAPGVAKHLGIGKGPLPNLGNVMSFKSL